MPTDSQWPNTLWVVRHGQSAANVAHAVAAAAGHPAIDLVMRDADVPLSPLGERQAKAVGHWFGHFSAAERPTVVLCSPYVRAKETASLLMQAARLDPLEVPFVVDERLREKEYGIIDHYTQSGILQQFPAESKRYDTLGKFYYRPPGGESWCDVILRLRNVLYTLKQEYRGERVLVVAHQVVVYCFRYLFERLTEEQILAISRETDIANCSVTSFECDASSCNTICLSLRLSNFVAPLLEENTPVTRKPDLPAEPES